MDTLSDSTFEVWRLLKFFTPAETGLEQCAKTAIGEIVFTVIKE